jgi:hypothetical protein
MNSTQGKGEEFPVVRRPRRRRRLLIIVLSAAVLALAIGGWAAYDLISTDRDLAEAMTEADQLDPGCRLEELETRREEVPREHNSALCVQRDPTKSGYDLGFQLWDVDKRR